MGDFERRIWCMLGLVFDAVDMQQAIDSVQQSVIDGSPCFISTPNLNFLVTSQSDAEFRGSVINSELSIADGMPLIWIARILNIPLPGRVPGSGMVEILRQKTADTNDPIRVFFFGGGEGIAEQACQVINHEKGGLSCCGFYAPGFGTVDEMSNSAILEIINGSNADFIIVSLGAKKGQRWIEQNREKLSAPVICHLGAVVNFVAGNVKRAPVWVQSIACEWLWRILQEPALWRRYFFDGLYFLKLLATRVLPYALWRLVNMGKYTKAEPVTCSVETEQDQLILKIRGNCLCDTIEPLRAVFSQVSNKPGSVVLDLSNVSVVDGAFLGLCLVLLKHVDKAGRKFSVTGVNGNVERIFRWNCVDYLL